MATHNEYIHKIEVITTKRKLSKSFIHQMRIAPAEALIKGEILGFVCIDSCQLTSMTVLINYDDCAYKLPRFTRAVETDTGGACEVTIKTKTLTKNFESAETADEYLAVTKNIFANRELVQIFI